MRLFVAADLPDAVRKRLAGVRSLLRDLPVPVRWAQPEGVHLTFAFLGEVAADRTAAIAHALRAVSAGGVAPFALAARGLGAFPAARRPRVIWAGLTGDLEAASRLKRAIDRALRPLGFEPEDRPFRPHLTLGRVADGKGGDCRTALERHREEDFGAFEVRACVLFESQLGPGGAHYRAIETVALACGAAS